MDNRRRPYAARVPPIDPTVDQAIDQARERGSTLPFVLVCWTVAALMAFGAIAAALNTEYRAIVDAGFILQIDDPGLGETWDLMIPAPSVEEYRRLQEFEGS